MLSRLFGLVVLLALMAGGIYYWKSQATGVRAEGLGAVAQTLRDTATTGAVKAALELNRTLNAYHFDVSTDGGVVVLRGLVPGDHVRLLAERVVTAVPEVRRVDNQVTVSASAAAPAREGGRTLGESLDDHALEAKVRLAFSLNRELKGSDLDVRAYRRQVALAGEVTAPSQRLLAVQIANDTSGVAVVKDEIHVRGEAPPLDRRAAVVQALGSNPNLGPYALAVAEEGGRLVLHGRVRTGAEKDLAGLLAQDAARGPVRNAVEIKP